MNNSYLYDDQAFNQVNSLAPLTFKNGDGSLSLFPVPQDNSVGTNDMANAITLISFPKSKINFDNYFKGVEDNIETSAVYLPPIDKDVIGFGQVRRFMVFGFKNKLYHKYIITKSIGEYIKCIAILDPYYSIFLFEIEKENIKSNDPFDVVRLLKLVDLSDEKVKVISEIVLPVQVTWSKVSDKIFLYDRQKKQLRVLDKFFKPTEHPLANLISQYSEHISFMWIEQHPTLPIAILYGGENGEAIIGWDKDRNVPPLLLYSGAKYFSFSPDGKWVVFSKDKSLNDYDTYISPVSESFPYYIGAPILLKSGDLRGNNYAWTHDPVSFVWSYGNNIYRWDLTNQPHPGSEKGVSFHDYIVERDLEKLTKEKRQGLGAEPVKQ